MENDFTVEIIMHLGVIKEYENGWKKEVNIIKWNGKGEVFDIRDWNPTHEHMSRGITLDMEAFINLCKVLKGVM